MDDKIIHLKTLKQEFYDWSPNLFECSICGYMLEKANNAESVLANQIASRFVDFRPKIKFEHAGHVKTVEFSREYLPGPTNGLSRLLGHLNFDIRYYAMEVFGMDEEEARRASPQFRCILQPREIARLIAHVENQEYSHPEGKMNITTDGCLTNILAVFGFDFDNFNSRSSTISYGFPTTEPFDPEVVWEPFDNIGTVRGHFKDLPDLRKYWPVHQSMRRLETINNRATYQHNEQGLSREELIRNFANEHISQLLLPTKAEFTFESNQYDPRVRQAVLRLTPINAGEFLGQYEFSPSPAVCNILNWKKGNKPFQVSASLYEIEAQFSNSDALPYALPDSGGFNLSPILRASAGGDKKWLYISRETSDAFPVTFYNSGSRVTTVEGQPRDSQTHRIELSTKTLCYKLSSTKLHLRVDIRNQNGTSLPQITEDTPIKLSDNWARKLVKRVNVSIGENKICSQVMKNSIIVSVFDILHPNLTPNDDALAENATLDIQLPLFLDDSTAFNEFMLPQDNIYIDVELGDVNDWISSNHPTIKGFASTAVLCELEVETAHVPPTIRNAVWTSRCEISYPFHFKQWDIESIVIPMGRQYIKTPPLFTNNQAAYYIIALRRESQTSGFDSLSLVELEVEDRSPIHFTSNTCGDLTLAYNSLIEALDDGESPLTLSDFCEHKVLFTYRDGEDEDKESPLVFKLVFGDVMEEAVNLSIIAVYKETFELSSQGFIVNSTPNYQPA